MKTFEEAFAGAIRVGSGEIGLAEIPLKVRDTIDAAKDLIASEEVVSYCEYLADIGIDELPEELNDEILFQFAMGLVMTAFVSGLRVGQEMNKPEMPHETSLR